MDSVTEMLMAGLLSGVEWRLIMSSDIFAPWRPAAATMYNVHINVYVCLCVCVWLGGGGGGGVCFHSRLRGKMQVKKTAFWVLSSSHNCTDLMNASIPCDQILPEENVWHLLLSAIVLCCVVLKGRGNNKSLPSCEDLRSLIIQSLKYSIAVKYIKDDQTGSDKLLVK